MTFCIIYSWVVHDINFLFISPQNIFVNFQMDVLRFQRNQFSCLVTNNLVYKTHIILWWQFYFNLFQAKSCQRKKSKYTIRGHFWREGFGWLVWLDSGFIKEQETRVGSAFLFRLLVEIKKWRIHVMDVYMSCMSGYIWWLVLPVGSAPAGKGMLARLACLATQQAGSHLDWENSSQTSQLIWCILDESGPVFFSLAIICKTETTSHTSITQLPT